RASRWRRRRPRSRRSSPPPRRFWRSLRVCCRSCGSTASCERNGGGSMKRLVSSLIIASGVVLAPHALAKSEACKATNEKEVRAVFSRWKASSKAGEAKKVVANYAAKSILLPTVSNKPRLTAAEKEDYFVHFLEKKPVGQIDFRTIEIDCNVAIDA